MQVGILGSGEMALGRRVSDTAFHRAWKSRKLRGIPTFPPPRQRVHLTCGHAPKKILTDAAPS
jgi:hypothetical protein